ncbi:protein twisted gastrulation-like protein, partial [Dinothrombium tinctorium]
VFSEECSASNDTDSELSSKSHVESLSDPSPDLFGVLTEDKDRFLRWTSYTFPVQISFITSVGSDPKEIKFGAGTKVTMRTDGIDQEEDIQASKEYLITDVNCTVAYMSQCMSWNKCKSSCRSMGASSYRWFHDGCCECVGSNCINYGINESRCLECPLKDSSLDSEMSLEESQNSEVNEEYEVSHHEDEHHSINDVKKPDQKQNDIHKIEETNDKESDIQNSVPKKPSL